ncbi:MAG: YicC family protein [Brevinematales bacterium]|nr:YicC family protein [Brevinematales bacterium]
MRSMTGFSTESLSTERYDIFVEIKSLNSKYFEFKLKGSDIVEQWEPEIRKLAFEKLKKGKIDIYIKIVEKTAENYNVIVNKELAKKFEAALKSLSLELTILPEISLKDFIGLGHIFYLERISETDGMFEECLKLISQAIDNLINMMNVEAEKIIADILNSLNKISELTNEIENQYPTTLEKYKESLKEKIKEMLSENIKEIDINAIDNRVLFDAEMLASKIAINEEIVRLKSHIEQFKKIVLSKEEDSRKLDFIAQEMFREINTISAKSVDLKIIENTINVKAEIEKIREHLRNIV